MTNIKAPIMGPQYTPTIWDLSYSFLIKPTVWALLYSFLINAPIWCI